MEIQMTSINAGGAFYRVQNELTQNSERLSQNMQRLASGKQNIAPGDRTGTSAIAFAMKAESASLKVGMTNGTEALQSIEMVTNDLALMNDIVVRLEELHALGSNAYNTTEDKLALTSEATSLLAEMSRISSSAQWKGNDIIKQSSTDTTTNTMNFGRNTDPVDLTLKAFKIPEIALGFNNPTDDIFFDIDISAGSTGSVIGSSYTAHSSTDPSSLSLTPAQIVAARTVDTKAHDTTAQSKLEIGGAVYFEHLNAAAQSILTTVATADVDAVSKVNGAQTAAAAARYSAAAAVVPNGTLSLVAGNEVNDLGRLVSVTASTNNSTSAQVVINGTGVDGEALSEVLTLVSSAAVDSTKYFKSITSINLVGTQAGTLSAGVKAESSLVLDGIMAKDGAASMAPGRNITFSTLANANTGSFVIKGTDINDKQITETVTGPGATLTTSSAKFFKTVTSITTSAITAAGLTVGVGAVVTSGPKALAGSDVGSGSAEAKLALAALKQVVDELNIGAGTLYNKVSNVMSHMGSLNAGYQVDVSSKMDVDFAGETALLAKNQILAQAGTAMLAQANAQQQSVLALLQS
jgi:flagellin